MGKNRFWKERQGEKKRRRQSTTPQWGRHQNGHQRESGTRLDQKNAASKLEGKTEGECRENKIKKENGVVREKRRAEESLLGGEAARKGGGRGKRKLV